jgi:two-component system, NarL family, competent response regulator ComA
MIRILLVDDHISVREGTKAILEQELDMQITAVSSGIEALELVKTQLFDVMLFDLNMPLISGLELAKRIMGINSDTIILIYTGYDIYPHFNLLIEAGVSGFVSKTATRKQLINAIRCSLDQESVIPTSLLKQLRRKDIRIISEKNDNHPEEDTSINEKEQEILRQIAKGKSNKDLAEIFLMSQRSIEYNLTRIFSKLNVRSRAEAVIEAKRLSLISDQKWE